MLAPLLAGSPDEFRPEARHPVDTWLMRLALLPWAAAAAALSPPPPPLPPPVALPCSILEVWVPLPSRPVALLTEPCGLCSVEGRIAVEWEGRMPLCAALVEVGPS